MVVYNKEHQERILKIRLFGSECRTRVFSNIMENFRPLSREFRSGSLRKATNWSKEYREDGCSYPCDCVSVGLFLCVTEGDKAVAGKGSYSLSNIT